MDEQVATSSVESLDGKWSIAIHGGAGVIDPVTQKEKEEPCREGLRTALEAGVRVLKEGGTAQRAVEAAIIALEDCIHFNAGRGSIFTSEGTHEMEASMMDGLRRKCGAAVLLRNVKNPIKLARILMNSPDLLYVGGEGAENLAKDHELKEEPEEYFFSKYRYDQLNAAKKNRKVCLDHDGEVDLNEEDKALLADEKFGTVGCVAMDMDGNLCAGTSTGGLTNKIPGRIGDSSIVGVGTFADNSTCAISCTGSGEVIIRHMVGHDLHARMKYQNISLNQATNDLFSKELSQYPETVGVVGIDGQTGEVVMEYNTRGMFRGSASSNGDFSVKIWDY